ncbi:GTPase [Cellulophaga baltica]|uniref:GTPase n=1 Tax=Cellulophaga TaxID=104264 RepID=UPI001C0651D8|nr:MULTISPECIES: GTPase [Cellulophaga]MBU2995079.1 GTPase [Cellulophaga baltica]MDO6766474.1 GTPase [Cellulophaga sp. 1_MG-2023]
MKVEKLIFVYNANSGKMNAVFDSAHKIFSPKTYSCSLCDITYGIFSENKEWKAFRNSSNLELEFLHKDEFLKDYKTKFSNNLTFPVVLTESLDVFISTEELKALKSAENLISLIEDR